MESIDLRAMSAASESLKQLIAFAKATQGRATKKEMARMLDVDSLHEAQDSLNELNKAILRETNERIPGLKRKIDGTQVWTFGNKSKTTALYREFSTIHARAEGRA